MGGKKKVSPAVYQEMQPDEFINYLREDLGSYRDMTNNLLGNLNVISPEYEATLQGIADDYTGAQWSDLNRSFLKEQNALNQRNYNRFGSLGSTGALYGQESLQRDYNDLASRVASNTAQAYENLRNNYFNQQLNAFNAASGMYTGAGQQLYNFDQQNWNIQNINEQNRYLADVQNAKNSGNGVMGAITGAIGGGVTGFATGGPWGAAIGAGLGAISGGLGGSNGANSSQTFGSGLQIGTGLNSLIGNQNGTTWLGNKINSWSR